MLYTRDHFEILSLLYIPVIKIFCRVVRGRGKGRGRGRGEAREGEGRGREGEGREEGRGRGRGRGLGQGRGRGITHLLLQVQLSSSWNRVFMPAKSRLRVLVRFWSDLVRLVKFGPTKSDQNLTKSDQI